jgi:hypothetical protein
MNCQQFFNPILLLSMENASFDIAHSLSHKNNVGESAKRKQTPNGISSRALW